MYMYAVVHVRRTTTPTMNYGTVRYAVLRRSAPCVVAVHALRRAAKKKAAPCTAGTDGKTQDSQYNTTAVVTSLL